jgi:modification methylase
MCFSVRENMKKTKTSSFGVGKRESHDSSDFYSRNLYNGFIAEPISDKEAAKIAVSPPGEWADKIYCQSSENMSQIPDNSLALAFTSPPYNVGKDYDDDMTFQEYLGLIQRVGRDVYRALRPGGRYVINIANLGRKPYIPMNAFFYQAHLAEGFLPMGEIIWQKAKGASGSCAWGSWMSAKAPRLRDVHEYLLVLTKQTFSRPDKGESDIGRDEFMESTLSLWEIPPESAKRVGHPAPFPIELAARVIRLYSYTGDVVLDPFVGSGSTCVAALENNRHYVGYDISQEYCDLSETRINQTKQNLSLSE